MALNTQIYKYTTTQIFNYAYKAKDEKINPLRAKSRDFELAVLLKAAREEVLVRTLIIILVINYIIIMVLVMVIANIIITMIIIIIMVIANIIISMTRRPGGQPRSGTSPPRLLTFTGLIGALNS